MKSRILYPKNIWYNKQFRPLSKDAKILALFLVTNDNIKLTPIYRQQDLEICFVLGLTEPYLTKLKTELQKTRLFYFYEEWIYIVNDFSYCDYQGRDRVKDAKKKEIEQIPANIREGFKGLTTPSLPLNKR